MPSKHSGLCRSVVPVLLVSFWGAAGLLPAQAAGLGDYCAADALRAPVNTFSVAIPWQTTGAHGLSPAATARLLQRDGIGLTSNPPDSVRLFDARSVYAGGATKGMGHGFHDILLQTVQGPVSYTLTFLHPISALAFARAELVAGSNGITHPAWTAIAYDAGGNVVAETHAAEIRSYSNVSPRGYILAGSRPIRSVTFSANNHHFDAFTNIVLAAMEWCP